MTFLTFRDRGPKQSQHQCKTPDHLNVTDWKPILSPLLETCTFMPFVYSITAVSWAFLLLYMGLDNLLSIRNRVWADITSIKRRQDFVIKSSCCTIYLCSFWSAFRKRLINICSPVAKLIFHGVFHVFAMFVKDWNYYLVRCWLV